MKIAVLIGGIAYEIQRRLLEGIMKYAEEQNISIYVFTCNGDMYKQSEYGIGEFQIFHLPEFTLYDGIIFAKDTIQNEQAAEEITQRIRASQTPVISIESSIAGMPVYHVDNREATREMVNHLIEAHGVKDICYLSGPKQNPESAERLKGTMDAVREHGFVLEEGAVSYGDYWVESGRKFVRNLMEKKKKLPDAVVCANDDMALGVYTEFCKYGIRAGEEILITGYDHTSDAANLTPAIATIEKPQTKIGYEACKNLALAKGEKIESKRFQVKYFYRGSCGCAEHEKKKLSEVQLQNIQQKLEIIAIAEMNKNMVSDLNDCENLQDFCECLKFYIVQMNFSFVYLCLCEEDNSADKTEYNYKIKEEYSEKVFIPIAYEKGRFTEYPYFECKELLPKVCKEKIGSQACIVVPIHFRRNCLGYCVMCGSGLALNSTQFQNWIMNIANALENIYKQSELKRLIKKLNGVWKMDNLTQIYNRAGFFHYADGILEECKSKNIPIGMLFIDINKLKLVNDGYGHEEGDFYIRSVADSMKALKDDKQLLMRYGGDEFVVLGKLEKGNEFARLMEGLNPKLEEQKSQNGKAYEMSVSMGFQSVFITKEFKLDQLMEQADREMYKMKKKKGRAEI